MNSSTRVESTRNLSFLFTARVIEATVKTVGLHETKNRSAVHRMLAGTGAGAGAGAPARARVGRPAALDCRARWPTLRLPRCDKNYAKNDECMTFCVRIVCSWPLCLSRENWAKSFKNPTNCRLLKKQKNSRIRGELGKGRFGSRKSGIYFLA